MAKLECRMAGDLAVIADALESEILSGSMSATKEDESRYEYGDARLIVKVYERYSVLGSNRVSLNITMLEHQNIIFFTAITSGGSQAVLFKLNTFGEEAFLDCIRKVVDTYRID